MTDVTTLNAKVVVRDSIEIDPNRIRASIDRAMGVMQQAVSNPLKEIDRQLNQIAPSLTKLFDKGVRSILSDRELQKLTQYSETLDRINRSLTNLQSHPGFDRTSGNVSLLREGIGSSQDLQGLYYGGGSPGAQSMGMQALANDRNRQVLFNGLYQIAQTASIPQSYSVSRQPLRIHDAQQPSIQAVETGQASPYFKKAHEKIALRIVPQQTPIIDDTHRIFEQTKELSQHTSRQRLMTASERSLNLMATQSEDTMRMYHALKSQYPNPDNQFPPDWQQVGYPKKDPQWLPGYKVARGGYQKLSQADIRSLQGYQTTLATQYEGDIRRQLDHVVRNDLDVDKKGNIYDPAYDLDRHFAHDDVIGRERRRASLQEGNYQLRQKIAYDRNLDPYSGDRDDVYSRADRNQTRVTSRINRDEGNLASRQRIDTMKNLNEEYNKADKVTDRLYNKFKGLDEGGLRVERRRAESAKEAGYNVKARMDAIEKVEQSSDYQRRAGMGRGSYSHAFRYGSQNAAFALEDYMISSQYGGFKAGMRAITNNMTAIASAATGAMNPLLGAGIIGGVAIAGASAPLVYDQLTGDDERGKKLYQDLASPRKGAMFNIDAPYRQRQGIGQGVGAARNKLDEATQNILRFQTARQDIMRAVTPEINRTGSEQVAPSDYVNAFRNAIPGSSLLSFAPVHGFAIDSVGPVLDYFSMSQTALQSGRRNRNFTELGQVGAANRLRGIASDNINERGDPVLLQRQQQEDEKSYARERAISQSEYKDRLMTQPGYAAVMKRRIGGELVGPDDEAGLESIDRQKRRNRIRTHYGDKPEEMRDRLEEIDREDKFAVGELDVNRERFRINRRDRDWQHRMQVAGFETNPVKRLNAQADIHREQINADMSLSAEQRAGELAAFNKHHKFQLKSLGDYPELGNAIDVGSAEDVRLRQKYFDRSGSTGTKTESEKSLADLVTEIRGLRSDLSGKKVKVLEVK